MSTLQNNRFLQVFNEALEAVSTIWWKFFDWLAVVSWLKLALVCLIVLITTEMVGLNSLGGNFMIISVAVKILAGGKRKAELNTKKAEDDAHMEALKRKLAEAQMSTLQAQIEPHFLFNTLAMIGQLIETDPKQASKVHMSLITYLRAAIPQIRLAGNATVGKQVDLSRNYLGIMQARMGERLSFTFDLPQHLVDVPFPPMLLQLLIENSIKHGLEPKVEGGSVMVKVSSVGELLRVVVEDDGLGFSPMSKQGVGLANIHEHLKLAYGDAAEFIIQQRSAGGTYASIRVPMQPNNKAQAIFE